MNPGSAPSGAVYSSRERLNRSHGHLTPSKPEAVHRGFPASHDLRGLVLPAIAIAAMCVASAAEPAVQHVLHISVDGLGGVYLQPYLAETPGEFPAFARLAREGSRTFNARCDYHSSFTEPNHSSMLTGRPVLQQPANATFSAPHGQTLNYDPGPPSTIHNIGNPQVPYKASVFDVVHDRGFSTAFFAGKQKFDLLIRSYDADNGAPDTVGPDNGTGKIDTHRVIDWVSPESVHENVSHLVNEVVQLLATNPPTYTFLHLSNPDIIGHFFLWGSDAYKEAVREVDRQLTRIMDAVAGNPALSNRTAIVLTADHGGDHHHLPYLLPVYTIPLLLWGPGVPAGLELHDLFSNRAEPGDAYLDYDAPRQPLRNGDTGNLALALLGLPSIPQSYMIPNFKPQLHLSRGSGGVRLRWAAGNAPVQLQAASALPGTDWTTITGGITIEDGWNVYHIQPSPDAPARFYRLAEARPSEN
jgi:hypothetical protein